MLLLILGWSVVVASLASLVENRSMLLQVIFYLVAGLVWLLPMGPLLRWMHTGRWRG